jgi:uroporphyrinogen-III decarboxylase
MEKTPAELYRERLARVEDAVQLKVPDRVPILASFRYFPAICTGMTYEDVYYKPKEWREINKQIILEYQPDMYYPPITESGKAYEILGLKQCKWPGHGIPPTASHQFVEGDYMKADEYDAFLTDTGNWMIRTYLPRIAEAMEPLKDLPPLDSTFFGYHGLSMLAAALVQPEIENVLKSLIKAGHEIVKTQAVMNGFDEQMAELGFPAIGRVTTTAFDVISDFHRGMRGAMLDMYRQPDKLLQAIEKIEPIVTKNAIIAAKISGNPWVFIPLHRGADGFMSDEQFKTFYWPSLKRLFLALIEEGLTPCPFFEGAVNSRLEYFLELPKGKVMARFDTTDLFKAKEIIGDTMCICGNVPVSAMQVGTPDEVRAYCKKLIDVVGKDGGFIICTRTVLDEAKPENVKAWIDFTKEYGVYR